MTDQQELDLTAAARSMWALGDYGAIADLVSDLGRGLVTAAGVRPGQRVLDVAAGTGNASIPAAQAGATVFATDLVPELLERGQQLADRAGLAIDWSPADAQQLPSADAEFDVVLSCIGAMFAPDHHAVARELLRVCRPGGTVAMANWTPGGEVGAFFELLDRFSPPPPGAPSPTAWGDPAHASRLLWDGLDAIHLERRRVVLSFTGAPAKLCAFYRAHFPPVIATYQGLAGDVVRTAALDHELLAFATAENSGQPDGPARYEFEYLLVVGRRRE